MHAILFSIAATSALYHAGVSGPVSSVEIPGCRSLGDMYEIDFEVIVYVPRPSADGRILSATATADGHTTDMVAIEPAFPLDIAGDRGSVNVRFDQPDGTTVHAGFPVPGRVEYRYATADNTGTICKFAASPMTWNVIEYPLGDANLDGVFNSSDLVQVFQAGYETEAFASWEQGDWSGDQRFDSTDLVVAFAEGAYADRPTGWQGAVPEPSAFVLMLLGIVITKYIGTQYPGCQMIYMKTD